MNHSTEENLKREFMWIRYMTVEYSDMWMYKLSIDLVYNPNNYKRNCNY